MFLRAWEVLPEALILFVQKLLESELTGHWYVDTAEGVKGL